MVTVTQAHTAGRQKSESMATTEDLRFGRKHRSRTTMTPFERATYYHGVWSYGARERYIHSVRERLKALKELSRWRGQDQEN